MSIRSHREFSCGYRREVAGATDAGIITTILNKLRVKRKVTSEAEEEETYTGRGDTLSWTKIEIINTAKEIITEEFSGF